MSAFEISHMDSGDRGVGRSGVTGVRAALDSDGIVIVHGFPTEASRFIDLLTLLGEPLEYYGGDAGAHPEHSAIWRVAIEDAAAGRGELHAVDGPLAVHSSQSLLDPRPRYFAMLMVNCGWQDRAPGNNGESLLVSWRDVATRIRLVSPPNGEDDTLAVLSGPVEFPDGVRRPLVYTIDQAVDGDDIGVRLKSDLAEHLAAREPGGRAHRALEQFCAVAQAEARQISLASGDLVIVDNDRWGHGRASVLGHRQSTDGTQLSNPRELWSATVA